MYEGDLFIYNYNFIIIKTQEEWILIFKFLQNGAYMSLQHALLA
jgi:hypothetical protein